MVLCIFFCIPVKVRPFNYIVFYVYSWIYCLNNKIERKIRAKGIWEQFTWYRLKWIYWNERQKRMLWTCKQIIFWNWRLLSYHFQLNRCAQSTSWQSKKKFFFPNISHTPSVWPISRENYCLLFTVIIKSNKFERAESISFFLVAS